MLAGCDQARILRLLAVELWACRLRQHPLAVRTMQFLETCTIPAMKKILLPGVNGLIRRPLSRKNIDAPAKFVDLAAR